MCFIGHHPGSYLFLVPALGSVGYFILLKRYLVPSRDMGVMLLTDWLLRMMILRMEVRLMARLVCIRIDKK